MTIIIKIINKNFKMIPDLKNTLTQVMRYNIQDPGQNKTPVHVEEDFKLLSNKIIEVYHDIYSGNVDENNYILDQHKHSDYYQHKPLISLKQFYKDQQKTQDRQYLIFKLIMKYHILSNFGKYFYINKKKIEASTINKQLQEEAKVIQSPFKIPLLTSKFIK